MIYYSTYKSQVEMNRIPNKIMIKQSFKISNYYIAIYASIMIWTYMYLQGEHNCYQYEKYTIIQWNNVIKQRQDLTRNYIQI